MGISDVKFAGVGAHCERIGKGAERGRREKKNG